MELNLRQGENMETNVRCYSGYIYAQEPRVFTWQGKEIKIKSLKQVQQEPGKRLFKVIAEDGKLFELCYNEAADRWSVVELLRSEKHERDL